MIFDEITDLGHVAKLMFINFKSSFLECFNHEFCIISILGWNRLKVYICINISAHKSKSTMEIIMIKRNTGKFLQ